jgi:anaerobic carbon-monoxide dehydrogenase iron sulfur subunit
MQSVFVHMENCLGCRQCEFACAVEHSASRDPLLAAFENPLPHARIRVEAGPSLGSAFPNRCRHCDPAPCQQTCPTGAIVRDEARGLVQITTGKCIACAMCAMVCPFDVLAFHAAADGRVVATKCDGCVERLSRDEQPACVEACKSGALVYGELNDLIKARRPPMPELVAAWHGWGEAATRVAKETTHGNSSSR